VYGLSAKGTSKKTSPRNGRLRESDRKKISFCATLRMRRQSGALGHAEGLCVEPISRGDGIETSRSLSRSDSFAAK
jgi:hypothetical protein